MAPATSTESNKDKLDWAIRSPALQTRLLIIEDDTATNIAIAKVAEGIGYVTKAASSVEEADRLLRAERYDCITLDLTLGKDSGVQLISTLAARAPDTPIIFVSGSPNWLRTIAASVAKVARLNILQAISKPIDFSNLRCVLTAAKERLANQR